MATPINADTRLRALELAVAATTGSAASQTGTGSVVDLAQAFVDWLSEGKASPRTKPTTTIVQPDPTYGVPETPAVVETPTVTGDVTSTTSSDVSAASTSQAAPPTEAAPVADIGTQPDVTTVNAKVLEFNRRFGREATVALLQKFGGSKVPEVPAGNHAALLTALTDGLAAA